MNILLTLFFLFSSFLSVETDEEIDALFLKWNKITLNSLRKTCMEMQEKNDRSFCENRAVGVPGFWSIDEDSLNRASVRWKFLKKIVVDAVSLGKNWTVIEVMKTGERVKLVNYVICYQKSDAVMFSYEYSTGEWVKVSEKRIVMRKSYTKFTAGKALLPYNSYPHDVIITNFVYNSIQESNYYVEHTIDNGNKIVTLLRE